MRCVTVPEPARHTGPGRPLISVNPATEEVLAEHRPYDDAQIERALERSTNAARQWAGTALADRTAALTSLADLIDQRCGRLARLVTTEMGKRLSEARGEAAKCASVCRYYAQEAAEFLADEPIETDARCSFVAYQPLGSVLAVMPWNFPLWQVFRCAVPALTAGNAVLLKHASNVSLCALALADLFIDAGFPPGVFQTLLVGSDRVAALVRDPRIHAVSLTGSTAAGRATAEIAGAALKPTVLELGGSDAFVVLNDADLDDAVANAITSRFQNAGQSCIAAKRFIVEDAVADRFVEAFTAAVQRLQPGDPLDDATTLAPMARRALRDEIHTQVEKALSAGARALTGCRPADRRGFYYEPSIIEDVTPGTQAHDEELFGPVAVVMRASNEASALVLANATSFGLGGSVWTRDAERGERFARRLACGSAFVNGVVKSDPRLPFGGIKTSGLGRELSRHGLHEFVNVKTIWQA
jgi:succinate-semialdehyde dehydrogenase / glutarate-semialdehyde dehydrogenase